MAGARPLAFPRGNGCPAASVRVPPSLFGSSSCVNGLARLRRLRFRSPLPSSSRRAPPRLPTLPLIGARSKRRGSHPASLRARGLRGASFLAPPLFNDLLRKWTNLTPQPPLHLWSGGSTRSAYCGMGPAAFGGSAFACPRLIAERNKPHPPPAPPLERGRRLPENLCHNISELV